MVVTTGLAAPSDLRAETVSSSFIYLSWNDNSDNEDGFKIEYGFDGDSWNSIGEIDAGLESIDIINCQQSTTYYFRIRAFNDDGYSDYSNIASATTLTPIFTDSFDSDSLYAVPDDESWGWVYSGTSRLYVTDEKSYPSGGRCVKFIDSDSGSENYVVLRLVHTPVTAGTLSMWLYIRQEGGFGINGWEDEDVENYEEDGTFYLEFISNGQLQAMDDQDFNLIKDPYTTGGWFFIEIDFDMSNSSYDVTIDGELLTQNYKFMYNNSFPSMASLDIKCFNNAEMDEVYMDTIELQGETVEGRIISVSYPSQEIGFNLNHLPPKCIRSLSDY